MARTVDELLARLLQFLPTQYASMADLLVAIPGAFALVESKLEEFVTASSIEGASDIWLTLMAAGYGVERSTAEADETLRTRLRNVEGSTTPGAILDLVNAMVATHGVTAELVEWWEGPFLSVPGDDGAWANSSYASGGPSSFTIRIPQIGVLATGDSFLDLCFLDNDAFAGADGEDPIYAAILAEVERKRPAGVRWALIILAPES